METIKTKCSNCGKNNTYTIEEYKGRSETLCKFCNHTLTICGWAFDDSKMEDFSFSEKLK